MRRLAAAVAALVLVACSGGDGGDDVDASPPTTEAAPETSMASPSTPATTAAPDESPDVVGAGQGLLGLDLPAIEPLAGDPGPTGAGRPTLEWAPVDGAAEYLVVVRTAEGEPHWGDQTTDTEVTVGAGLVAEATGPRVSPDMTWAVIAVDADGVPIAQSAPAPVVVP